MQSWRRAGLVGLGERLFAFWVSLSETACADMAVGISKLGYLKEDGFVSWENILDVFFVVSVGSLFEGQLFRWWDTHILWRYVCLLTSFWCLPFSTMYCYTNTSRNMKILRYIQRHCLAAALEHGYGEVIYMSFVSTYENHIWYSYVKTFVDICFTYVFLFYICITYVLHLFYVCLDISYICLDICQRNVRTYV